MASIDEMHPVKPDFEVDTAPKYARTSEENIRRFHESLVTYSITTTSWGFILVVVALTYIIVGGTVG